LLVFRAGWYKMKLVDWRCCVWSETSCRRTSKTLTSTRHWTLPAAVLYRPDQSPGRWVTSSHSCSLQLINPSIAAHMSDDWHMVSCGITSGAHRRNVPKPWDPQAINSLTRTVNSINQSIKQIFRWPKVAELLLGPPETVSWCRVSSQEKTSWTGMSWGGDEMRSMILQLMSRLPSECPDVKNYKWRLNPVWHRRLYSSTHMTKAGVKELRKVGLTCTWKA